MELRSAVVVGEDANNGGGASGCLNMLDNQCFAVVGVLANNYSGAESEEGLTGSWLLTQPS